jgi:hypothetical protein
MKIGNTQIQIGVSVGPVGPVGPVGIKAKEVHKRE